LNISITEITDQYLSYIDLMQALNLELAAEYMVMAAMLAEIKSRLLLPRIKEDDEEELDPQAELIRKLKAYEQTKIAAEHLDVRPRVEREIFVAPEQAVANGGMIHPEVELNEMLYALKQVLHKASMYEHHEVSGESLSTRQRMTEVLNLVRGQGVVSFMSLFDVTEGRQGIVVTFLAILELTKEKLIKVQQTQNFGEIHVLERAE
jgi:segregation and condensation protein A